MVLDYCIVGGGISALYHAYQFHKKHPKASITIIQDSSRLGGRIYTHTLKNGSKVDMGAGRIATHHPKTMKLIKELGLSNDLVPIPKQVVSIDPLQHFPNELEALLFLTRIAKTALHKIPKKHLYNMSFSKMCRIFFAKKIKQIEEAQFVSGYDTEFELGNAWIICHTITDLYDTSREFAVLTGGLGRITDTLVKRLKQSKKINFKTETIVLGWKKPETKCWEVYCRGSTKVNDKHTIQTIRCRNLHIATPLSAWNIWYSNDTIRNVPIDLHSYIGMIQPISLCRLYSTYEDTHWISSISKCVSKSDLRYIIPINETTVMSSYVDGERSEELGSKSSEELEHWLDSAMTQTFPGLSRFIPKPTEIKRGHWKVGVHIWKPHPRLSPPSHYPTSDPSFSMSGEAFSQFHQGWIEGALETHTEPKN